MIDLNRPRVTNSTFPHPIADKVYDTVLDEVLPDRAKEVLAIPQDILDDRLERHIELTSLSLDQVREQYGERAASDPTRGIKWRDLPDRALQSMVKDY